MSGGVKIDVTPPEPERIVHTDKNVLKNPSFELSKRSLSLDNFSMYDMCTLSLDFIPYHWSRDPKSCAAVLSSLKNLAREGNSFLFIKGSLKQDIEGLKVGELYRVTLFSSHSMVNTAPVSNKEGFISVGNSKHVFLLYSRPYRLDEHNSSLSREIVSWHKHSFYFTATNGKTVLEIGSTEAKTGIFLDNLLFQHVEKIVNNSLAAHVSAQVVYLHQWGSIHGAWSFFEDNSPIAEYSWAIGITFIKCLFCKSISRIFIIYNLTNFVKDTRKAEHKFKDLPA